MFRRVLTAVFVAVALAIASPAADAATAHIAASEAGPEAAHTAWEILHLGHVAGFPLGHALPVRGRRRPASSIWSRRGPDQAYGRLVTSVDDRQSMRSNARRGARRTGLRP